MKNVNIDIVEFCATICFACGFHEKVIDCISQNILQAMLDVNYQSHTPALIA